MLPARLLLLLCIAPLAGCFTPPPGPASSWKPQFEGVTGEDVICLDIALVEASYADRYLNDGLWQLTDEQILPLEHKGTLNANGLRVGLLRESPPDELQSLLTSERSCANPRHVQVRSGKAAPALILGPTTEQSTYRVGQGDQAAPITLDQAQFLLTATPTLLPGNRVRIRFVPEVRHGEPQVVPWRPNADRSGWSFQTEQPLESYPHLAWEITLAPNDLGVIGARYDRPGTLGHAAFLRGEESSPVQRLLVVRARSRQRRSENWAGQGKGGPPPLAVQAGQSVVRGAAQ